MAFFDDAQQGVDNASDIIGRAQAGFQGRLPEFQANRQNMAVQRLGALKTIQDQIENIALSSVDDPAIVGPMLKQLQQASKGTGVQIPDSLIEHYTNDPLSLGMSFDTHLEKNLNPAQLKQMRALQVTAMRRGPHQMQAMEQLDIRRFGLLMESVMKTTDDLMDADPTLKKHEAFDRALKTQGAYAVNIKNLAPQIKVYREAFGIEESQRTAREIEQGDRALANAQILKQTPTERALQLKDTELGDKVLQQTFDPKTGEVLSQRYLPRGRLPKDESTEKVLTTKEKQNLMAQKRGEARRLIEANFPQGIMGEQARRTLGKDEPERRAGFEKLVEEQFKALLAEAGFSLEDLTAKPPSGTGQGKTTAPQAAPKILEGHDAAKFPGKTLVNPKTGEERKSDGKAWQLIY